MAVGVQQNVFGLQVAINNVGLMQVSQSQNQLSNVELGTAFVEASFSLKMPEEFTSRHVVGNQVKIGRSLEGELQANNEW
jgi:hypothetical protein